MKHLQFIVLTLLLTTCSAPAAEPENKAMPRTETPQTPRPELDLKAANNLADLPLSCIQHEYPNKLGQSLGGPEDLGEPSALHPAFYGCFDWHSAVHGHWSLVALLKDFPALERADEAKKMLAQNLTAANIAAEVAYFKRATEKSYERTYGWAWLLKLDEELLSWDAPLARELHTNLQPLTELIAERYLDFLPRLNYAIRTGEHPNTAFGLAFACTQRSRIPPLASRLHARPGQARLPTRRRRSIRPDGRQTRSPRRTELQPRLGTLRPRGAISGSVRPSSKPGQRPHQLLLTKSSRRQLRRRALARVICDLCAARAIVK